MNICLGNSHEDRREKSEDREIEKRRSEKGEGRKMLRYMQILLVTFAFGLANGVARLRLRQKLLLQK